MRKDLAAKRKGANVVSKKAGGMAFELVGIPESLLEDSAEVKAQKKAVEEQQARTEAARKANAQYSSIAEMKKAHKVEVKKNSSNSTPVKKEAPSPV